MSDPASTETLGQEVSADVAAVKAFVQSEVTNLKQDAANAYEWLKGELEALAPEVLNDLKTAVNAAVTEAVEGDSEGTVVANSLDILARDGAAVLGQVKSTVLTAVVGLTAQPSSGS